MAYNLHVQAEAIMDMQDAFDWYQAKKDGLGFEFLEEVETGFQNICNNPQYYTAINGHFRRHKVKRFPYLVIYEIEPDTIIINAVRHSSRKPKF